MEVTKRNILVIDDEEIIHSFLRKKLSIEGYEISAVSSAEAALHRLKTDSNGYDVILCDLKMPRISGLDLLAELRNRKIDTPLILITAHGSLETAVKAMREGAFDYILKPINLEEIKLAIERALRAQRLEKENIALRAELHTTWTIDSIIGKSRAMHTIFELIERVAPTLANVLIQGESGTGKEMVARAIHSHSSRGSGPFVAINCAAIPNELLESELFGHVKGAFTGAHQNKRGLFEEAEGGTIFLDEIGDMNLLLQAKLLRVIQEKQIKAVGDNLTKPVDVRIVAATHRDLKQACKNQQFREDLFYRLCVIPIELPPLRQRKEDIPILANHFLKKHAATHGLSVSGLSSGAMSKLLSYGWPGNVRELENIIERSVILTRSEKITENDLSFGEDSLKSEELIEEKASQRASLQEIERHYINLILNKTAGKKERAAQILGIDRKTLRRKIREYGLAQEIEEDGSSAELPSKTSDVAQI